MFRFRMVLTAAGLLAVWPGRAGAADPVFAAQGWTAAQRRDAYQTPIGSQLLPRAWFAALEEPFADRPFRAPEHLARFGFLPTVPEGKADPDALPFGFTDEPGSGGARFVGMTCAACHTAQIEYRGSKLRIDGGPGMIDSQAFVEAMTDALRATARDAGKWSRFAARVLGANPPPAAGPALRAEVESYAERLREFATRNRPMYPAGPGRIDAMGMLSNEVIATAVGIPANYRVPSAPVKPLRLWLTPKLDWLQWNGGVQNPAVRNMVEGLSGFGHLQVSGSGKEVTFRATARLEGAQKVWERLDELSAPAWPEDIMGKIDPKLAAAGAKVYAREGCATCHADKPPYPLTPANKHGKQFIKIAKTPLAKVGTDPGAASEFVTRTALTGRMSGLLGGKESVSAPEMFFTIAGLSTEATFAEAKLPPKAVLRLSGYRDSVIPTRDELLTYKAAPLAGVWSTAPYLHNGSVPTLYDLLLPADKRPKRFRIGGREFDAKRVGFESGPRATTFALDTAVPGNSNAGHEYGTAVTEDERWALVEYLKTL